VDKKKVYFIDLPVNNKPRYVCDIAEKIYGQQLTSTIYCKLEQSTQLLDKLLWTWKQESFVPHTLCPAKTISDNLPEPILITSTLPLNHKTDTLILFDPINDDSVFSSYNITIDFAETYNSIKIAESRKRFKSIRDAEEYDLEYLKLSEFLKKMQL
jgi:DNA polymerase-3 subunit chi